MSICIRTCLAGVLAFALLSAGQVRADEPNGRKVMEEQKNRHKVQTEYGEETMLLVDKSGGREKREVKRYTKESGKDLHKYMLAFLSPADVRGTALLTWENQDKENDQWLYMPATQKMQRIAEGSKKSSFMGTDFTYEDMEPEQLDNFTYTIQKSEKIKHDEKDYDCYVIEAVPADKDKARKSGYSKRIFWISKENILTLKVEFYDRRNRLEKTQTSFEFENVKGTVWRPKKTLMDNHAVNHKTLTLTTSRKLEEPIDDMIFTERFILSGSHTK